MARLTMLKSRVQVQAGRLAALGPASKAAGHRITGRALQTLRFRIWVDNPCCAMCGRVVVYPNGFDLDHIVALDNGGSNDDSNYQVLCNGPDGCHALKTAADLGYKPR